MMIWTLPVISLCPLLCQHLSKVYFTCYIFHCFVLVQQVWPCQSWQEPLVILVYGFSSSTLQNIICLDLSILCIIKKILSFWATYCLQKKNLCDLLKNCLAKGLSNPCTCRREKYFGSSIFASCINDYSVVNFRHWQRTISFSLVLFLFQKPSWIYLCLLWVFFI